MRGKWRDATKAVESPKDLASRLSLIEHRLGLIDRTKQSTQGDSENRCQGSTSSRDRSFPHTQASRHETTAFSGETSITHNLTVVEDRLEQMGIQYEGMRSPPPTHSFSRVTPALESSTDRPSISPNTNFVCRVLDAHGIAPSREQWDGLMQNFCNEVHILVPFLHQPTLWNLYEKTWHRLVDPQPENPDTGGAHRVETTYILLCLANGRCVESSRFEGDKGPYSAGGTLYSAAREIYGDLLEGFEQCTDQILVLQTVVLMVMMRTARLSRDCADRIELNRWFICFVLTLMDLRKRCWPLPYRMHIISGCNETGLLRKCPHSKAKWLADFGGVSIYWTED